MTTTADSEEIESVIRVKESRIRELDTEAQALRADVRELQRRLAALKFGLVPGAIVLIKSNKRVATGSTLYNRKVVYVPTEKDAMIDSVGPDCGTSSDGRGTIYVRTRLKDGKWSGHVTKLYSWDTSWSLKGVQP